MSEERGYGMSPVTRAKKLLMDQDEVMELRRRLEAEGADASVTLGEVKRLARTADSARVVAGAARTYAARLETYLREKGLMDDCEIAQQLWELRGEIGPRQESFDTYAEKHGVEAAEALLGEGPAGGFVVTDEEGN